ncbi:MAG TPA: hypothetical protein DET40_06110 [Lentisphaeria bacterium]|nr:MAG: hypothetical protein A2X45_23260 [Lentisphaerae bacterium GWF2_50_93]HCE43101.1 hypothetical protein [Lentisphaeria bacterium]
MVKNITLSADEVLIQKVRQKAVQEHTTLNNLFRTWLRHYASKGKVSMDYGDFMKNMSYVRPGRKFSREEMNER